MPASGRRRRLGRQRARTAEGRAKRPGRSALPFLAALSLLGSLSACGALPADSAAPRPGVARTAAASRPAIHLGPEEAIFAAPGANLPGVPVKPYAWPDGGMGILKSGAVYTFFAANDGNLKRCVGTLDNPGDCGGRESIRIGGLKSALDYAGGGPVYRDPATNTLLMIYHGERWKAGSGGRAFYGTLGLAKSSDGGATWADLGEIVTPHVPPEAVLERGALWDAGGGAYLTIDGYFYVYFRDLMRSGEAAELAVARARVADVVEDAIARDRAAPWRKYRDGAWEEPGLGGRSSPLEADNQLAAWLGVSYNAYLGRYIMIAFGRPWPATTLYWLESSDGLTWTSRTRLVEDPKQKLYVTLVGLGDDPRVTGRSFYVYYVSSAQAAAGGNRNLDGVLVRRLVTLGAAGR